MQDRIGLGLWASVANLLLSCWRRLIGIVNVSGGIRTLTVTRCDSVGMTTG